MKISKFLSLAFQTVHKNEACCYQIMVGSIFKHDKITGDFSGLIWDPERIRLELSKDKNVILAYLKDLIKIWMQLQQEKNLVYSTTKSSLH